MFLFKRAGVYYISYLDESDHRQKRVSTKTHIKSEALAFLSNFDKMREQKKNQITHIKLSDFKNRYIEFIKVTCSPNYVATVEVTFRLFSNYAGDIPLQKITFQLMEKYLNEVFNRAKQSARVYYIILKASFTKAEAWGYLKSNPLSQYKLPKIPKNNPIFLELAELETIISKECDNQLRGIYRFAFHTGLRLGEITNLQWSSIDFINRVIKVVNTEEFTTKGKRERVIPLNQVVFDLLSELRPKVLALTEREYIFNSRGFRLNEDFISKRFKKCVKLSGVNPSTHFHNLRSSFACNLVKRNVSIFHVQKLLGHSSVQVTERNYAFLKNDSLVDAVKVLECSNAPM